MDQVGASPLRSIVQHLREVLIRLEEQGISVSDPYSSNPDPAKNLNPDPSYFFTLSEKIKIMLLL